MASKKSENEVEDYMHKLDHPLKKEIEAVRSIIMGSDPVLEERIKWNAPSYHLKGTDLLTFNNRNPKLVHLILHHPSCVQLKSPKLEGDYKDRRMMYFSNMDEINKFKPELEQIIRNYISLVRT